MFSNIIFVEKNTTMFFLGKHENYSEHFFQKSTGIANSV